MNWDYQREAVQAWNELPWWKQLFAAAFGKCWFLGNEQRPGFTAAIPFYLFQCKRCGHCAKDYPHGYIERRYLLCSYCEERRDFVPFWVPFRMAWDLLRLFVRLAREKRAPKTT